MNEYSIKDIVYIHVNGQKSKTIIDQPFSMDDKGIMTLISTDPLFANMRYDDFFNIFGPTITKLYNTFHGQ